MLKHCLRSRTVPATAMDISEPVTLARLPRSPQKSSEVRFGPVWASRSGVKRKRHEICAAVEGTSVNIYEVSSGRMRSYQLTKSSCRRKVGASYCPMPSHPLQPLVARHIRYDGRNRISHIGRRASLHSTTAVVCILSCRKAQRITRSPLRSSQHLPAQLSPWTYTGKSKPASLLYYRPTGQ